MDQRDRGSATLTTVVLTPVFLLVALAAFQAALWNHARTEARSIARDAAVLVARQGQSVEAVTASSQQLIDAQDNMENTQFQIDPSDPDLIVVEFTGEAPGIFRWTTKSFSVTEAVPVERFRE